MPRLLFNSDGDSMTLSHYPPPITSEQVCRVLDELADAPVAAFLHSLNRGGDTYSHFTRAGEVFGAKPVASWEGVMDRVRRKADNIRHLHDTGIDPLAVSVQRAHQLGMEFWPSLRMNDIHEDDSRRFFIHRSGFKEQHRELLLGSPYPDPNVGYPQDDYTWAFDYGRLEVRERRLALIEEVCRNYPIDGFELDFQRGPWYFRPDQLPAGRAAMTDLVGATRQLIDTHVHSTGGRPTLAIRVPPHLDHCARLGLDVGRWLQAGWIDVCTPMSGGYLDGAAEVERLVAFAPDACRVAAGLERYADRPGPRHASMSSMQAVAEHYLGQGARDIYLFNFDCHRANGVGGAYAEKERSLLDTLTSLS